ncbi:uncharacterized protein LOC108669849 [Hyalella azteca]|uniref:Uncharacterized protein LOC108669849 n=1 Tax=Hyalella azteca TaxID=294128 RepID=A0A8B7NH98_HYAAZ|nr:uncharacterized protein LOC108669849 [Hyalella azteca]
MPCLDERRRVAIANLITKYKGDDPTTWRQMSGLCCLLYTLPSGTLSRIPRGALMSCRCPIADRAQYAPEDEARQMECRSDLGEDYDAELWQRDNVLRVQAWAALDILDPYTIPGYSPSGRRKRALRDVALCNRASVNGVDDISVEELSAASTSDIMKCLNPLGDRKMDKSKAKILANKVRDSFKSKSWSSLTNSLMRKMNFIMEGLEANEFHELPSFCPPDDFSEAITVLGDEKKRFLIDELIAIKDKVLDKTCQTLANLTDNQLVLLNRLWCVVEESDFKILSPKRAVLLLGLVDLAGTLAWCNRDLLAELAAKALAYYARPLCRAHVREMGVVFAGIEAAIIPSIEPSALIGLTAAAMRAMTSDAIQAMSPLQLRCLSATTAMAMSPVIRESLSVEQKAALHEAIGGTGGVSKRGKAALEEAIRGREATSRGESITIGTILT